MSKLPTISTRSGDGGRTSLYSGEKVPKNSPAIKCVAKLDTFDSALGLIIPKLGNKKDVKQSIEHIQGRLVHLKGEIATSPMNWAFYLRRKEAISEDDVKYLDEKGNEIKSQLEEEDYEIKGWISYGAEGELSSLFDFARSLCREAEIEILNFEGSVGNEGELNKQIKIYINRLSDYLYWLARLCRK
jgi:cob(I)alamin adenosyltransferase